MNAATVHSLIESALQGVSGLTVTPGAVTLSVPLSSLPAGYALFDTPELLAQSTAENERAGVWRIVLMFLFDPVSIATQAPAIEFGVLDAFSGGLMGCGSVSLEDGGDPEMVENDGPALIMRKVLKLRVEWEES